MRTFLDYTTKPDGAVDANGFEMGELQRAAGEVFKSKLAPDQAHAFDLFLELVRALDEEDFGHLTEKGLRSFGEDLNNIYDLLGTEDHLYPRRVIAYEDKRISELKSYAEQMSPLQRLDLLACAKFLLFKVHIRAARAWLLDLPGRYVQAVYRKWPKV